METLFHLWVPYLVTAVEICGAIVIVLEVLRTTGYYLYGFFRRERLNIPQLRLALGQSMVMGLEFQVAADILKTALSPQWSNLALLGALVALRTVLNYLLERELAHIADQCQI
ncbi:MAG: DUF1622 domain-containing protein [Anaerolineae bacterium]|jgi:uncharacterized membrane protein|nr:DUF1622 domain-containing protein [Anaerolineae bacterium]